MNEISTKPICEYYKNIYKRMVIWFGFSSNYPYWLCDMDENELLKCILQLNMKSNMYLIFINVSIRIRMNNERSVSILNEYKKSHTNVEKKHNRHVYYENNIDKVRRYNHEYHKMKKMFSGINIFRKNNINCIDVRYRTNQCDTEAKTSL